MLPDAEKSSNFLDQLKKYTSKFHNPSNYKEISNELRNCKTIGDIKILADKTFPGWFVTVIPSYSSDYPKFQENWKECCKKNKIPVAQIIIVEDIEEAPEYSLLSEFIECFSAVGFQVRRQMEFIPCSVCSRALPSIMMYEYMGKNNMERANEWAEKCTTC
jgi:hypothetical protein